MDVACGSTKVCILWNVTILCFSSKTSRLDMMDLLLKVIII